MRKRSIVRLVDDSEPAEIAPGTLSRLAKHILLRDLKRPPKTQRERLAVCRAGLECDGVIGPKSTLIQQNTLNVFPPVVEKMLLEKMKELSGAIDGEANASDDAHANDGPPQTNDATPWSLPRDDAPGRPS